MLNVSAFPLCANRLKWQRVKLEEKGQSYYWLAVNVADEIPDAALTRFGGFDFNDMSPENGLKLLGRLEQFLAGRLAAAQPKKGRKKVQPDQNFAAVSVRAFMGAHGIRTSEIQSEDEMWSISQALWPKWVRRPKDATLEALRAQIAGIAKKARRADAAENLKHVDPRFWSGAAKHQRKVDHEFSSRLAAVSEQLRAPE